MSKPRDMKNHQEPSSAGLENRHAYIQAVEPNRSPFWTGASFFSLLIIVVLLVWSRFAEIEQITKGVGEVVPSSRIQVIQSLEGGILSELKVKEGMPVAQGDALVVIDPTRAESSFAEMNKRRQALLATVARLQAEGQGRELKFPPELSAAHDLLENERATFASRQRALHESVASLQKSINLISEELSITEPMVKRGLVPEVEALRLRRQLNEMKLQVTDRVNRYRADASTELLKVQAELSQVEEVTGARRDMMERTTLKAPLRGIVKNIRINTVGGVIQPGADIMEIVPLVGGLRIEAKVSPADVAFLKPGVRAVVKLTAYDYTQYGVLEGVVESVSPDTLRDERKANEQPFYRVVVQTESETLSKNGHTLPILPGMQASVDIVTGHRTLWTYFMKPIVRVQEAFHEK